MKRNSLTVFFCLVLLHPTYTREVVKITTETKVDVQSTNYPNPYPHSEDKEWVLFHRYGKWIIDIKDFHIEYTPGCTKDYLEVLEANLRPRRLCGRKTSEQILSTGSNVRVLFHSDDSIQETGFRLTFSRVLDDGDLKQIEREGGLKKKPKENAAKANVHQKNEFYNSLAFKVVLGSVGCAILVFTALFTFLCLEMRKKRLERRSKTITTHYRGSVQWPPLTRSNSKSYGRQDSSSSTAPLTGNLRY